MGSSQNLTICNGSIVQGQANGYGSVPIYAGGLSGLTIENVNTLSTGIDTAAVNAANTSNGLLISGCIFRSTSDEVTNRMSMVGALVMVGAPPARWRLPIINCTVHRKSAFSAAVDPPV